MTMAENLAYWKADEKGQQAWRDGDSDSANPYPPAAWYHEGWQQGWDIERDLESR